MKAIALRLAVLQDVLGLPVAEVVQVLDADDLHHLAGGPEVVDGHLGQPQVADLALVLQLRITPNWSAAGTSGSIRCSCHRSRRSTPRRRRDISTP
jgi:hypothetical protein